MFIFIHPAPRTGWNHLESAFEFVHCYHHLIKLLFHRIIIVHWSFKGHCLILIASPVASLLCFLFVFGVYCDLNRFICVHLRDSPLPNLINGFYFTDMCRELCQIYSVYQLISSESVLRLKSLKKNSNQHKRETDRGFEQKNDLLMKMN